MKTVILDAGHGGKDPGACGKISQEKNINLLMCALIRNKLQGYVNVHETRTGDYFPSWSARTNVEGDLYLSVHCNSFNEKSTGCETLVYPTENTETNHYAQNIHKALVKATGLKDRGIKKRDNLAVLSQTKMPAVLVELGFISNPTEETLLNSPTWQNKVATEIAMALLQTLGIECKADSKHLNNVKYLKELGILTDTQLWEDTTKVKPQHMEALIDKFVSYVKKH